MEVIYLDFSERFLEYIKFLLLWFFMAFCFMIIINLVDLYNISNLHQFVLLISFFISVSIFNKLVDYLIKEFKLERGKGKHAK